MSSLSRQVLALVALSAVLPAVANLLLRHGVVQAGEPSFLGRRGFDTAARLAQQPAFLLGSVLYGAAAVVWFRVLAIAEVSTTFPILVGLIFALVCSGAGWLFHESMPAVRVLGIFVILAGIALIARSQGV